MSNSALATLLREQAKERREREDEKSSMFGFLRGLDPSFDDRSKPGFGIDSDDPLFNIANMLREMFGEQTEVEKYDSNLENRLKNTDSLSERIEQLSRDPRNTASTIANLTLAADKQEQIEKKRQEELKNQQKIEQWERSREEVEKTGSLAEQIENLMKDPRNKASTIASLTLGADEQKRIETVLGDWRVLNEKPDLTSQQITDWRNKMKVLLPRISLDFTIPALERARTAEAVAIQRDYYREVDTLPLAQQKKMLGEMRDGELTETVTYQLAWQEYKATQSAKKDYDRAATKTRIALVPTPSQTEAGRKGFDMAEEFRKLGEPYPPAGDVDQLKIYGHRNAVHIYNGEWSQRQFLRTLATENPDGDIFERTLEYVRINPTLVVDLMKLKVDGKLNFFYNRDEKNAGEFKSSDFQRILGEIMGERVKDKPWFNFQDKPKKGESDEEVKARKNRVLILLSALNEKKLISPFLMVKTHDGEMMSWFDYRPKAMEIHQKSKKALLPDPGSTTVDPELKNLQAEVESLGSGPMTLLQRAEASDRIRKREESARPVSELEVMLEEEKAKLERLLSSDEFNPEGALWQWKERKIRARIKGMETMINSR